MIPAEVLKQVRRIEITAGRLVNEVFAGQYSSTFKGRGMEFSEVREYLPGDDVRSIDWNVTARHGHPFIKKFVEERELTIFFVVDTSLSQRFGSRGQLKSELAAEITAVLAFSALRNNDKTGMILYSDGVDKYIPPRKSRGHALRLIREVLSTASPDDASDARMDPPRRGTSLEKALEYLNRVQRRRAVLFLISDFLDAGYERNLRIIQKRHDTIAVPVTDDWEMKLPPDTRMLLEDAESGRMALVNTGAGSLSANYAERQARRLDELERSFHRMGVDTIPARTGESYVEAFLAFFRARAKRFR